MMPGAARQLAIEHIFEDHLTYSFGGGKRGVGSRRSEAPNQESGRPYNRRIVLETIRLHGADRPRRDRPQGRPDRLDHHPRARTTGTSSSAPARFQGRGYPATAVTLNPEGGFAIGTNVSPIGIIIGQQGRRSCNQLRNLQVRLLATMHTPRGIHRHIFPAWRSPETAVGRSSKGVYSTGLMNEFLWITWSGSILGHLDSQPAQEVVKWRGALRTS